MPGDPDREPDACEEGGLLLALECADIVDTLPLAVAVDR